MDGFSKSMGERMGPGGLPGLQSLCRAPCASGVGSIPTRSRQIPKGGSRGAKAALGPPFMIGRRVLALFRDLLTVGALLFLAGGGALAQEETGGLDLAAPVVNAEPDTLRSSGFFDPPTWVALRSLVVPGWGQAKNRSWLKALLVAGLEAAFVERLYFEDRLVGEYRRKRYEYPAQADFYERKEERHKGHRLDFIWWTSLFVGLSMGDAFVDAHLKDFEVDLGPGTDPDPEQAGGLLPGPGGPAAQVRLSYRLRW